MSDETPAWADTSGTDTHGQWARSAIGGVAFTWRWIPPGSYIMGSPKGEASRFDDEAQREVSVEGFWLMDAPVTQAQWAALGGAACSRFKGEERPVERVSWHDVQAHMPEGCRLPTEEEWEYACRAGTTGARYGGLDAIAVYDTTATAPVRSKAPNAWGLFDMLGNVWEWPASEEGEFRVSRGGSWNDHARLCRAASRDGWLASDRDFDLGVRLARGPASRGATKQSGPRPGDTAVARADKVLGTIAAMLQLHDFAWEPELRRALGLDSEHNDTLETIEALGALAIELYGVADD